MAKTATIRVQVKPEVKYEAEAIFEQLGLSASEAITLFYRQVIMRSGLPFELSVLQPQFKLNQVKENPGIYAFVDDSIDAGPSDLASNIDQFLYQLPKQDE